VEWSDADVCFYYFALNFSDCDETLETFNLETDTDTDTETATFETETRPETVSFETETRPRLWPRCPGRDRDETLSGSRDSRETETPRPRAHPCYKLQNKIEKNDREKHSHK